MCWAYSIPPGYNRVEVEAKTWWGPVTMPTGAPVESRFKKDHNLQIHIPTFADPFSDSLHKSFLDKTTLKLRNKNWGYLLNLFSDSLHRSFLDKTTLKLRNKNCGYLLKQFEICLYYIFPQKKDY